MKIEAAVLLHKRAKEGSLSKKKKIPNTQFSQLDLIHTKQFLSIEPELWPEDLKNWVLAKSEEELEFLCWEQSQLKDSHASVTN